MNDFDKNTEAGLLEFCINANSSLIKEALHEFGFNTQKLEMQKPAFIKRIRFLAKASIKQENNNNLLETIASKLKNALEKNLDRPISILKDLINKGNLGLQFRNLESLSEENIKEILRDKNLVDLLEELEDESQDQD